MRNCSCGVGGLTEMVGGSHHRTCAIYGPHPIVLGGLPWRGAESLVAMLDQAITERDAILAHLLNLAEGASPTEPRDHRDLYYAVLRLVRREAGDA